MFIREKKSKDQTRSLIQIVENRRQRGKTQQRVLRHVGTGHNPEEIEQLKRLATTLKTQMENEAISAKARTIQPQFAKRMGRVEPLSKKTLVDLRELKEKKRLVLGIHDVYGYVYDQLGFYNLFTRPQQREEAAKQLREIVLARICNPKSKRASVELLQEQFGVSLNLDHVYQMMDKIDDGFCERIQQCALNKALKLTGGSLQVLFYDATTLYFESFTEDELKQNGYSKDMKFNQPQVLLALLVTESGLPVGYEVFPGRTFEGHTLITALKNLKKRYACEEVVFVADRGLFSENNLSLLEKEGFQYIVGARIKNTTKARQTEILDEHCYRELHSGSHRQEVDGQQARQKIATFEYGEKRQLIVHYDSLRARKDAYERDKAIEKLRKKISGKQDPKALLNNYGFKKYLEIKGKTELRVNTEKVGLDARWDGLVGVVTNITEQSPEGLLHYYRGLWQVEESFRINKHDLRMRPIYHWKPSRVRAHMAVAFMAFACVRYLEYVVKLQSQKLSPEVLRKHLLLVQASVLEDSHSGQQFLLTAPITPEAKEIYRVVGVKIPPTTTRIKCGA